MKKKKYSIAIIVLAVLILFVPVRLVYQDGGTVEYHAILYKIRKYHKIDGHYKSGYMTGLEIQAFGNTIYQNITQPDIENYNETMERIIRIDGELYYEVKKQNHFLCEASENKITSIVNPYEIPTENNQANFSSESYTFVKKKDIVRVCNPSEEETIFLKRKNALEEKPKLIVNEDGKIDINSEYIQELYFKVNPSQDANILKEMYKNTTNFSDKYVIATGLINVIRKKELLNEEYIDQKDVEEKISEIFGPIEFIHQDVSILGNDIYQNGICGYWYRKNTKKYQLIHGCGGNQLESFKRKLISAEQDGDYLYLKEKSIYKVHDGDIGKPGTIYIYDNIDRDHLLNSFNTSANEHYHVELEDYIEKATTYTYVFKKNNSNYTLEKIKKDE